ncbi:hypothetical protein [Streptomyces spiralis]
MAEEFLRSQVDVGRRAYDGAEFGGHGGRCVPVLGQGARYERNAGARQWYRIEPVGLGPHRAVGTRAEGGTFHRRGLRVRIQRHMTPTEGAGVSRMLALITPAAGVIDDVSVAKNGRTTAHCCRVREVPTP